MTLRLVTWASAVDVGVATGAGPRLVADRRILRLVDDRTAVPLRAALEAHDAAAGRDRPRAEAAARTAAFTVSGWEEVEVAAGRRGRRTTTPTAELQRMTTLPLCVIMLARKLRGPNAHWIGDGATLCHVLGLVEHDLTSGAADRALVVTFDGDGAAQSGVAAVAALVAVGDAVGAAGRPLTAPPASAVAGMTATETLQGIVGRTWQGHGTLTTNSKGLSRA